MKRMLGIVLCALVVALAGCVSPGGSSDGMQDSGDAMQDGSDSGSEDGVMAQGGDDVAVVEDVTSVTDEFDLDELDALESELDSVDNFTLE